MMTARTQTRGRVTILDVAAHAGVSRQTVSNVVNDPAKVAPQTRERVEAAITALGYRASSAARSLRQQRAGAIGFELNALGAGARSDVMYPFTVELAIAARDFDCHIVTFGSKSDAPTLSGYEAMTRSHLVDAFVLADTHPDDPRPAWLENAGIPYATYGRVWGREDFTTWVDVEGSRGTARAVDHLVAQGYQAIGFLGWPTGSPTGDDRRRGWADACARHERSTGLEAQATQELAEAVAAAGPLVDAVDAGGAIVCASDLLALGVMRALDQRGLRAGTDVGVTGFDGSSTAALNGITTLEQPFSAIAESLLTQLSARLAGAPAPPHGTLLPPRLAVRASTDREPLSS